MNWKLENLTPEQENAIALTGYVGAFWRVLVPRLLAEPPLNTEPVTLSTEISTQSMNTYVPLAHRR